MSEVPRHVHLVGSIGLDTVEDVFRTVGGRKGSYPTSRAPMSPAHSGKGETGSRRAQRRA